MLDLTATGDTFCHEALFCEGEQGFVGATVPFVRGGAEAGQPVLVVVSEAKIERLRAELDGDADRVESADMARVARLHMNLQFRPAPPGGAAAMRRRSSPSPAST